MPNVHQIHNEYAPNIYSSSQSDRIWIWNIFIRKKTNTHFIILNIRLLTLKYSHNLVYLLVKCFVRCWVRGWKRSRLFIHSFQVLTKALFNGYITFEPILTLYIRYILNFTFHNWAIIWYFWNVTAEVILTYLKRSFPYTMCIK